MTEKLKLTLEEGMQSPLTLGLVAFSAWRRRIFPLVGGVIRNPTSIRAFPMSIPQSIASYFFLNQCSYLNRENTAKIQSLTNIVIQPAVSKNFPIWFLVISALNDRKCCLCFCVQWAYSSNSYVKLDLGIRTLQLFFYLHCFGWHLQ